MEDNEDDEIKREVNQMGKMIGTIIKEQATAEYFYQCSGDVNLQQLQEQVPDIVKSSVTSMFSPSLSDKAKLKKQLLQTSICDILMQAVSKQGYIFPFMFSVGMFFYQTTQSKVLSDLLSSLGLCASYAELIKFERSAAVTRSEDFPLLTSPSDESTRLCQWVSDNFDFNEDTLTGENTTHTMDIISCISPKSDFGSYLMIPRRRTPPTELLQIAERSISWKSYISPPVSMLS